MRRIAWAFVCIFAMNFAVSQANAAVKAVAELKIGREYDITFDDGDTIRNARITAANDSEYELQIRGLTERIKVEKHTIVATVLIPEVPVPPPPKKSFVRQYELQVLAELHYGLAAFTQFDRFFPAVGVALNLFTRERLPYVYFDALRAELHALRASDGERNIDMYTFILSPRYTFSALGMRFYAGAGGGVVALSLKSYSFSKTSYTYMGRLEAGVSRDLAGNIRATVGFNGNYWHDSLELLLSASGQIAVGYLF